MLRLTARSAVSSLLFLSVLSLAACGGGGGGGGGGSGGGGGAGDVPSTPVAVDHSGVLAAAAGDATVRLHLRRPPSGFESTLFHATSTAGLLAGTQVTVTADTVTVSSLTNGTERVFSLAIRPTGGSTWTLAGAAVRARPSATTIYVDAAAGAGGNGSLANPFNTLQAGLTAATGSANVWVRDGSYTPGVVSPGSDVYGGLASGALHPVDGASLRYVTNSGGRLALDDLRAIRKAWPRTQVFAMYGLTEAFRSAFLDPSRIDERPDSFGRALPGVELLLVDPATGAVLDGPGTGELVHAGELVALGYWNRPDATSQRFRPDPRGTGKTVVYSGDLVRRDEEGLLYFVARNDRMLKVQGHRISPDEVAAALSGCAGVGETAVLGFDGGPAGHRIVVVVGGDPEDRELPARALRQCRARLPAYMVPAEVRVLRALPHTQNGKIDLQKLQRDLACTDTN